MKPVPGELLSSSGLHGHPHICVPSINQDNKIKNLKTKKHISDPLFMISNYLLNIYVSSHRQMVLSVLIREASHYNEQWWQLKTQSWTGHFLPHPLLRFGEHHRRGKMKYGAMLWAWHSQCSQELTATATTSSQQPFLESEGSWGPTPPCRTIGSDGFWGGSITSFTSIRNESFQIHGHNDNPG